MTLFILGFLLSIVIFIVLAWIIVYHLRRYTINKIMAQKAIAFFVVTTTILLLVYTVLFFFAIPSLRSILYAPQNTAPHSVF